MSKIQYNSATFSQPFPLYSTRLFEPFFYENFVKKGVPSYKAHTIKTIVPSYSNRNKNSLYANNFFLNKHEIEFNQDLTDPAIYAPGSTQKFFTPIALAPIASSPIYYQNTYYSRKQLLDKPSKSKVKTSAQSVLNSTSKNIKVQDNYDPNPILIKKKPSQPISYTQNVSVKFLKPPSPSPADIIIIQQKDVQKPALAPKIIQYQPPPITKPAPRIIREQPPPAPAQIPPEHHVIPGKVIPPPPRKVITERLPQLPQPPQDIIVERWLEYGPRVRRVVFHPAPKITQATKLPKNVLIEWTSPDVSVSTQFNNLGVTIADPSEYLAKYGASLVDSSAIPQVARRIRPNNGLVLASESDRSPIQFIGDVAALSFLKTKLVT